MNLGVLMRYGSVENCDGYFKKILKNKKIYHWLSGSN